jgi:hypothetical protein
MVCIWFYLVGVYIPSENPEHVVVFANHGVLIVCKDLQDNTDKYHDLHRPQHVLDFLIVCTHIQDKTDVNTMICINHNMFWIS